MYFFDKKVFVVSGAHSGIGKACAELLLEQEATVVGLDLEPASILQEKYEHYVLDITDEACTVSVMNQIEKKHGKLDGLVNCAGIFASSKPFYEISLMEWNRVLETNLTGAFLLSKYAAHNMIKYKSGKIVNISCIRSKIFRPHMADYASSKAGVVALTAAMALDLAEHQIQVNSIAPGFTYTGMTAKSFDDPAIRTSSERLIPAGKIAAPVDIAKVALFLLSEMSDYMTGETIFVDGGYHISK